MNPTFIAAIYIFCGNFAPQGFAFCSGQLLSIAQNSVLFNLIGTTYGGDGVNTFALPDLRGRVPVNMGQGSGLSNYIIGQIAGVENVNLNANQIPSHTHLVNASSTGATTPTASSSSYLAAVGSDTPVKIYSGNAANVTMNSAAIGGAGGGLPVSIVQPILAVNYILSLFGIFPSQN